jgi:thiamine biosynthesis lipoprotein
MQGFSRLFIWSGLFFALLLSGCFEPPLQSVAGKTMGTTYQIQAYGKFSKDDIERRLQTLNKIFSTWDVQSELSNLNQMPIGQWVVLSDELYFVLDLAKEIQTQTEGYFDAGIGNALQAWGFGVNPNTVLPIASEIKKLRQNSSLAYFELSAGRGKKNRAIKIDLSAIAKGYAVDDITKLLKMQGIDRFLVEIGGEVRTSGKWKVGIENSNDKPIVLMLNNQSVATSGNYRNYIIWQGRRYAHILNPKTAMPAQTDLFSVSVLHSQNLYADAYATAMMAMGSKKAITLAKKLKLSVVFILNKKHHFQVLKINL